MFEQLKKMAFEKLGESMFSNSLDSNNTKAAAEEGASSLISSITEKLGSGGLDQITDLFSGSDEGMQQNGLFESVKNQFSGVLENKGMNRAEAEQEADSVLPGLIGSLKEKFMSTNEADKDFDLGALANIGEGGIGGILDKAKGFFN